MKGHEMRSKPHSHAFHTAFRIKAWLNSKKRISLFLSLSHRDVEILHCFFQFFIKICYCGRVSPGVRQDIDNS